MTSDSLILLEEMGNHWRLGMTFWMNQNLAQSKRNWCGVTHWNCPMKKGLTLLPGFFRVFKNLAKTNSLLFWPPSGSAGSFLGFPGFHNFLLPFVLWSGWSSTQKDGFYSSRTDTVPILQKGRIVVVLVPVLVVVVVVVVIFIIQLNPIIMNRRRSFYLMSWWSTEGLARWGTWNLLLMFKKSWPVGKWFENLEELEIRSFNG